jgi:hypothetical protein
VYSAFKDADINTGAGILNGSTEKAPASTTDKTNPAYKKTIVSCNFGEVEDQKGKTRKAVDCPMSCRELPYPTTAECINTSKGIPYACAAVPDKCKITRVKTGKGIDKAQAASCPEACKAVPPLKANCTLNQDGDPGDCLDSAYECRMAKRSEADDDPPFQWRPSKPEDAKKSIREACDKAQDCVASLNAYKSCVYVVADTGRCDGICRGCPSVCRIDTFAKADAGTLPEVCKDDDGKYLEACKQCHDGCDVREADIKALDKAAKDNKNCTKCPWEYRLVGGSGMDMYPAYTSGGCSYDKCAKDYRGAIPRNVCEMCLFSDEAYIYDPPLNTRCSDECKPPDNAPVNKPGTNIGGDGLAGDADIQDLSRLMVPAYVLPLFNIVATLVFIKGLSMLLGGDIEIPGISKVF